MKPPVRIGRCSLVPGDLGMCELFPVTFGAFKDDKGGVAGDNCIDASVALAGKFESVEKLWRWMDKPHDR
jgi:hypothetical protein